MDFINPADAIKGMRAAAQSMASLSMRYRSIRGVVAGALLGFATRVALTATI